MVVIHILLIVVEMGILSKTSVKVGPSLQNLYCFQKINFLWKDLSFIRMPLFSASAIQIKSVIGGLKYKYKMSLVWMCLLLKYYWVLHVVLVLLFYVQVSFINKDSWQPLILWIYCVLQACDKL